MKKLFLGLLVVMSISTFANTEIDQPAQDFDLDSNPLIAYAGKYEAPYDWCDEMVTVSGDLLITTTLPFKRDGRRCGDPGFTTLFRCNVKSMECQMIDRKEKDKLFLLEDGNIINQHINQSGHILRNILMIKLK